MNILFLLKNLNIGGVEVVSQVLANKFIQEGHNVCFFVFMPSDNSIISRLNSKIKVYQQTELKYSNENITNLRYILQEYKVDLIINQWGLPYTPTRIAKKALKGMNVKYISVHHNSPEANGKVQSVDLKIQNSKSLFYKKILNLKKIVYKIITRYSMRYVYNQSDIYLILSPSFIDKFKQFTKLKSISKIRVQTNPVTIDSSDFKYNMADKQTEIIYVGRIDYNQKRTYRVIDTWRLLEEKYPDWKLTIIGDGIERSNLEKQVAILNLRNVSFEGFKHPEEYYKRASILILTSEYEGFPLVLAECMSYGVIPVVYGSYSAVYDIIQDNSNGIIMEPDIQGFNQQIMASKISEIINDSSLRNQMATEAIITSKKYSLDQIYYSWNNLFKELSS